jgi:serine/threonine protein kinase/tetratricopeptide (TPR) repeat protein
MKSDKSGALSPSRMRPVDEVCDRFKDAWKAGLLPRIEDYLGNVPEPERPCLLRDLLKLELEYRRRQGETLVLDDYRKRFPDQADLVVAVFREQGIVAGPQAGEVKSSHDRFSTEPEVRCPGELEQPVRLGRYRITSMLGKGGFGVVYKGFDEELRRDVAIKVPHRQRIAKPEDAEAYLAEARILASLDHAHIVPVYDLGRSEDGLCYVVSKFIEGSDLATRSRQGRFSFAESAQLVATVAEALQHAHQKKLVHRDLKPANILLDTSNKPYLTDFGLALKEEDFGKGPGLAGTPAYMSPEQANGEGHRVDGRSDIYSLGVVFYELLTGQRPFVGRDSRELFERICTVNVRPPRQLDATIPKELERICLKALAKRATERYTTAFDLADDLRHWFAPSDKAETAENQPRHGIHGKEVATEAVVRIVPKGLRSFDAQDADFFLELLPGPRDREGLPESIRFWKSRIEETDVDKTFRVGLLYGPSGCGKSSLVKAGLLPRLANQVMDVYVEATAEDTEARLLRGLRKACPDLPGDYGLVETIAALRRGRYIPRDKKLLIVLDQFEQWLHAKRAEENTELVQALRHCDGGRVQAIVLVRDDFWMAATRFMDTLEVRLVQGNNAAAVDLFDPRHAMQVLTAFGRAFGALPETELPRDQKAFLDQAVAGLTQDDKVISVRLALFAEMVKGKPWAPTTLKEVGGMEGVGVTFLEETFSAATAPPLHRRHEKPAQAVLKALLPETGTDIKGNMRSQEELLAASAYGSRTKDFDALLRILDSELRLITPTDHPEGPDVQGKGEVVVTSGTRYYQLTHDYLVPALREWLTRKQKETRRGRAQLRLAELTALWSLKFETRHLPSLWEWEKIRLFTRRREWTPPQRRMMRAAGRRFAIRVCLYLIVVVGVVWPAVEGIGNWYASSLINDIPRGTGSPELDFASLRELRWYRRWTIPSLKQLIENDPDPDGRGRTASILIKVDPGQENYLFLRLLRADWTEFSHIRRAFLSHCSPEIKEQLWRVLADSDACETERIRAACALAQFDSVSSRWGEVAREVSLWLVTTELRGFGTRGNFSGVNSVTEQLRQIIRDSNRRMSERVRAMVIVRDFDDKKLVEGREPETVPSLYAQAIAALEDVLAKQGRDDGARRKILESMARDVGGEPAKAELTRLTSEERYLLINLHAGRAEALTRLGRHDDALKDRVRGIKLLDGLPSDFFPAYVFNGHSHEMARAFAFARLKDHGRATAEADHLLERRDAQEFYPDAACVFALAAAVAQDQDDPILAQAYTSRAVELLRRAVVFGYEDAAHMKQEKDLAPLRLHPEFQKILKELEAKAKLKGK